MAPPTGQGAAGGDPTLYIRDAASFGTLSDAFQQARADVASAASHLDERASAAADPFGHAAADTTYAQTLRETLTALDNLGAGLLTLARQIEEAGTALVAADRGVARSMTP
jgi:phosphate uptake regulator